MSGFEHGDYGRLKDLHRQIFEKFVYITDREKFGLVERWEDSSTLKNIGRSGITKFTGDCEEFSLVSMDKVRERGFHARMVLCLTEGGEGHAICEVASKDYKQAYYFDNRFATVATAEMLSKYKFIAVSPWDPEPADPRPWLRCTPKKA